MRLRSIRVGGLRNFRDTFACDLHDDWTGEVPDDLLLTGPNGSGKTTLLELVTALWEELGEWARLKKTRKLPDHHLLNRCRFAAVEIEGFTPPPIEAELPLDQEPAPLWLIVGNEDDLDTLLAERPGAAVVGRVVRSKGPGHPRLEHPGEEWLRAMDLALQDLKLGQANGLPNVVFLESESRRLLAPRGKADVYPEPGDFHWVARYEATERWQGHLESSLRNLKLADEARFAETLATLNTLLRGKRITRFDEQSLRLLVDVDGGDTHTLEELSAGERQCLIMLFMISRWLRPGGVVLIDEPDLHLHRSLLHGLMGCVRKLVRERQGQLVIASHATPLWREYPRACQRLELGNLHEVAE